MAFNENAINEKPFNNRGFLKYGSGSVISVAQDVHFYQEAEGSLISIAQSVKNTGSGSVISIEQFVRDNTQATWLERHGWYALITVGSYVIPANKIHGAVKIVHTENDSSEMSFTMLLDAGVVNLSQYENATVKCDVQRSDGTFHRVFTGYVNIPDLDIIEKKITFSCVTQRKEKINTDLASVVPTIGYYSNDVFGSSEDLASELDKRLSTIPYVLDFDTYGQYHLTNIAPAASANYTFGNSDIYRDSGHDPKVIKAVRSRFINKVTITAEYQYQRCYQLEKQFNWHGLTTTSACEFLQNGYSVPTREMISAAADSAGWPIHGAISFTPVLAAGFYSCSGATLGWSTSSTQGVSSPAVDSNGNKIFDSSGNQIMQYIQTGQEDVGSSMCFGASWLASTRFTQNISETFTMTVSATQSIAQFGTLELKENFGVVSQFDSSEWENYPSYQPAPSGVTTTPAQPSTSFWFNKDTNRSGFNSAMTTILNRAKTTILKSHRDNRVIFYKFIDPRIQLWHTITLNATPIACKGKVYRIEHTLNISEGEAITQIELALSKSSGSGSDSTLSIPTQYSDSVVLDTTSVGLESHWGLNPNTTAGDKWTGYIGNKWVTLHTGNQTTNRVRTTYPISFRVDTPSVNSVLRDNRTLATTASYTVAIPDDSLTITV